MKEVKEWNGKPRWMWVWDVDAEVKEKKKKKNLFLCILTEEEMKECNASCPVCSYEFNYKHCAEIEEVKRPCTKEELLELLKKQGLPMLQCKSRHGNVIYTIILIKDEEIVLLSSLDDSLIHYDYSELCNDFTLLDGTELWVKKLKYDTRRN